jgi:opacity protein-like surface antigen
MRHLFIAATLLSAVAVAPVSAQAVEPDFIGVRAGTLGAGAEFGLKLSPHFTVRAIAHGANFGYDDTSDNIRYDGDLKLASYGAQLDYRFSEKGPLYVTAGVYKNDNKVVATGRANGTVTVGGVPLTDAQVGTLNGRATFDDTVPYLGIGARWPIGVVEINLEAGAYFQGRPRVTLTSDSIYASLPEVQTALENERLDLEDDIKDFKTYPVVELGLRYKF